MHSPTACPLCRSAVERPFFEDRRRPYFSCGTCGLIFVPPSHFPSPLSEKAEYDLHENDPGDPHYRRFLDRLFAPLLSHLPKGAKGLDFGCGPGPTLSLMFQEAGFEMDIYDPFYFPEKEIWTRKYNFVTATEVFEHLHQPFETIEALLGILKPGGILGLMTKLSTGKADFPDWHYKNDKTHVVFFSSRSFAWIAEHWNLKIEMLEKDVVLLRRLD